MCHEMEIAKITKKNFNHIIGVMHMVQYPNVIQINAIEMIFACSGIALCSRKFLM